MENKFFLFAVLTLITFSLFSCKTTEPVPEIIPEEIIEPEIIQEEPEIPEPEVIEPEVNDIEPEEVEPEEVELEYEEEEEIEDFSDDDEVEFLEPEPEEPEDPETEEYLRSTNNLDENDSVSKEEFSDDKTTILNSISELSQIMESKDFVKWLEYIEPSSITYYSNPANLRKAEKKLPNKMIQIRTISDYFLYVFIPSRKRSQVDEIRYISKTNIKAVQVKEDFTTVVYYYFTKVDGKWMVHLPPV